MRQKNRILNLSEISIIYTDIKKRVKLIHPFFYAILNKTNSAIISNAETKWIAAAF